MRNGSRLVRTNLRLAQIAWGELGKSQLIQLKELSSKYHLSVGLGDIQLIEQRIYVTHSGLLRLAQRSLERATLIGLTSLRSSGGLPLPPELDRRRALFVLGKIDEILAWERANEQERDSRPRAYYFMAIHEQLPRTPKHELKQVGWTKAAELAKVARREGERFESAIWLHKARSMQTEEFKREIERHLTGQETEPWEILYFKVYKSQLPVIEQALSTAALMLGSDKSRGYCLETICADFLARASMDPENGNQQALLLSLCRLVKGLASPMRIEFLEQMKKAS